MFSRKRDALELLCTLYVIFKLAKTKGDLALESHCEQPEHSPIFVNSSLSKAEKVVLADSMRLLTLGLDSPDDVERFMVGMFVISVKHTDRMDVIIEAFVAHCKGYAPQISIEFARAAFGIKNRPTFQETEEAITNLLLDDYQYKWQHHGK
jgi:flagellar motor component MotA